MEYLEFSRGPDKTVWTTAFAYDLGWLAQGIRKKNAQWNQHFIFYSLSAIPEGKILTYGRLVFTIRPTKAEKKRARLTASNNRLN